MRSRRSGAGFADLDYPPAVRDLRARTRRPSPFVAAVLSLLLPGLGQLYAGRPARALAFAAAPILGIALLAGVVVDRPTRDWLLANLVSPDALSLVLLLDLLVAAYRILAVVDAWLLATRVARALPATRATTGVPVAADATPVALAEVEAAPAGERIDRPALSSLRPRTGLGGGTRRDAADAGGGGLRPTSAAGLLVVVAVLLLGHLALARYDRIAYDTITGITAADVAQAAGGAPIESATGPTPGPSGPGAATALASPAASALPETPWNGTDRLNVLLVGTDQRPGDVTFNTDTMIVASIDPTTGEVAMFSVPRDTEDVPLPPGSVAAAHFAGGAYPNRINSLWAFAQGAPGLFPGTDATRGATALKGALGALLGIDIKYYVMVDFAGFKQVVDTLGGAMIDVQLPVQDFSFPTQDDRGAIKLYIPPGIQYMTGAEALAYARARHQTNDFDRSQRQQRVITSIREQTDVLSLLDPNRLQSLSTELRSAIHTDYPASRLPALITLLEKVDLTNLRSYVFTPPIYETQCAPAQCVVHYFLHPKVPAIQQAVRDAFTVDPALAQSRLKLAGEDATVSVLDGSKDPAQGGTVADYLDYLGVGALVPPTHGGRADRSTYPDTVVTFYNGAESRMPETVRVLERTFGVTIATADDPSITVDAIVITGRKTPRLQVPAS